MKTMSPVWKINLYEIQTQLYWILAFLILNSPTHGILRWFGWASLGYGCYTFVSCFVIGLKAKKSGTLE